MTSGRDRVQALVAAAARIADTGSELGRRARASLAESTGLSRENLEWALTESLETQPTGAELDALYASVVTANAVHVVLPANVFVAAHRAIALALAASSRVYVKPSRREPHFAALLAEAAPGLFELVAEIAPARDDTVWIYGGDQALAAFDGRLGAEVTLNSQGPGFGVALVEASHASVAAAEALARDVAAFDQRGCLSPRVLLVLGNLDETKRFTERVAGALEHVAERIPLGRLDADERAEITRFRDTAAYAGGLYTAGPGFVFLTPGSTATLAPVGRNLCVTSAPSLEAALAPFRPELVTAVGVAGSEALRDALERLLPEARVSELGRMQRPAFDGPADRRGARWVAPS